MSFAIGFVSFREGQVKRDTIPKPVGLGSRGPISGLSVRHRFGAHPVFIQLLSGVGCGLN
jgi:hypothetical protein